MKLLKIRQNSFGRSPSFKEEKEEETATKLMEK